MTTRTRTPAKAPAAAATAPAATGRNRSKVADAVKEVVHGAEDSTQVQKETILSVTVTRKNEDSTTREEVLDVRTFVTAPAYVKVKHGATRQPVQYEGVRVDVEISRPCYVEEIDAVLAELADTAANKVYDELEALMGGEIVHAEAGAEQEEEQLEPAPYTADELASMDLKGLKAVLKEQKLKAPAGKANDDQAIFDLLLNHFGLELEPDGEQEGADEPDVTYEEVAAFSDEELVAFAKANEVTIPRGKAKDMDFIFNAVCEMFALNPEGEGTEDGAAPEGEDPYTFEELQDMTDEQLLDVADANGIDVDENEDPDATFYKICEALGVEVPAEEVTAEAVNAMSIEELDDLVADFADTETPITVSARESKNLALYRKAAIKSLGL